ncbi:hypothetical protein C8A03DRAFT_40042 [Achaetomium macrosporum]|uniref:F-box domain-containing protein n=1 Tax=Achaetomium macrosporum TaxID=79813 RepID=A0AAN7HAJ9_9PEZI|nr:hypothetical protein C8A03DRAFT_40042 [Achaetomium macrosporum]
MAYSYDGYYASPTPTIQPLGARSASVSSNSSSTSYSNPYSNGNAHHGSSRTMSPASGISDPGAATAMYSRGHYSGLSHEHPPAAHQAQPASLMTSQSQFVQTQVVPTFPLYSPTPIPRRFSRAPPYSGYSAAALPQHPSPLSYQAYAPMDPSFAITTTYDSSPALAAYHTLAPSHSPAMMESARVPEKFHFLELPSQVINEIRKYLTWDDCRRAYRVSRWFRDNFHPSKLPEDEKTAGLLNDEKNHGRPGWFACYHCYTFKGLEHFELFKWGNTPVNDSYDDAEEKSRTSLSPSYTPAPPTSNPHYDPSLTGSSLRIAASKGRLPSSSTSTAITSSAGDGIGSYMDQRMKETWGVRRFCIDCGLRNRWYRPGDVIEPHKPLERGQGYWVCRCWKFRLRPRECKCEDCGSHIPLSTPSRRR